MLDLEQTLNRCRQGNPLAWEALVKQYQGRVFATALYYLHHRDEAADASQEAFIKVYRAIGKFQVTESAFLPWLLSVVRNCCIDRLRKSGTRSRHEAEFERQSGGEHTATSQPESVVSDNQRKKHLYQALAKISPLNRDIILLKDIQGLKNEDVAEILSLPVGTIKSRAHRAKLMLGKLLAEIENPGL